jgi:hypothetical protein
MGLGKSLTRLPVLGPLVDRVHGRVSRELAELRFQGSAAYWEQRYARGGSSGFGSFNRLAHYKAKVLNDFVADREIADVIEFGCGDGNQLSLYEYPRYIGLDVSKTAVGMCRRRFAQDSTKSFYLYDSLAFSDNHGLFRAELSLSIDVIYHLVEDSVFESYMRHLFAAARRHVVIYSSDFQTPGHLHQRNHAFSAWVRSEEPEWRLEARLANPHGYDPADAANTSLADFFIYSRAA